jgi:hypothetical protein
MTSTTFLTILFALACFSTSTAFAGSGPKVAQQKDLSLTLSVSRCKELSEKTLHQAEAEAARIFRQIGITVRWRDIESESVEAQQSDRSASLDLRIVSQAGPMTLSKSGLALTHWAEGSAATAVVMLDRATSLAGERQVPLEVVLGCLIAHELGHVLLRSPRHSPFGIMRNPWNPDDLHKAKTGYLGFTDDQPNPIRDAVRRLAGRTPGGQDQR